MSEGFAAQQFDDFEGFEDIQPDLRTCSIRQDPVMGQDQRTIIKPRGVFAWSDTTPDSETLDTIVLATAQGRHWWKGGYGGGNPPYCSSPNGVVGVSSDPEFNGRPCAMCPMSKFGADRTPPPCGRSLKLLCLDTELVPFVLKFSESGINPTKDALKLLVHDRQVGPPWKYLMRIGLEHVQKQGIPKGYFVPKWPTIGSNDPNESAKCKQLKAESLERVKSIRNTAMSMFKILNSPPGTVPQLSSGASMPAVSPPTANGASQQPFVDEPVEAEIVEPIGSETQKAHVTPTQVAENDPFAKL